MKPSSLERLERYLHFQAATPNPAPIPQQLSITISRESGAGATTVAEMIVEQLNAIDQPAEPAWIVFDKNLAKEVLFEHHLPSDLENFVVEDARLPVESVVKELLGLHPNNYWLAQQTTKTILRLAGLGRAVIVGRGAEVITQLLPYVFHVRLIAPLSKRIIQATKFYGLTSNEAALKISAEDHARRRYLRRYFNADWGNPLPYHLVVNTGKIGFADASEIIMQAALRHHREFLQNQNTLRAA